MKLEDFERVAYLRNARDYFDKVRQMSTLNLGIRGQAAVRVGTHDLRPDLAAKVLPEIALAAELEIRRVEEELAKLGVTV